MDAVKFLDMFPCCKALAAVAGGLDAAEVRSVLVNRQERRMELEVWLAAMPAPSEIGALKARICAEYGLTGIELRADYPQPEAVINAAKALEKAEAKKSVENALARASLKLRKA